MYAVLAKSIGAGETNEPGADDHDPGAGALVLAALGAPLSPRDAQGGADTADEQGPGPDGCPARQQFAARGPRGRMRTMADVVDAGPSPATHPQIKKLAPVGHWQGDSQAVVLLTFDVDAETAVLAEGQRYAADLSTMSHQAYGPRVGVPRILKLLARYELRATFFVPGLTAQRWPDTVRAIVDAGHEVACHGHTHQRLTQMTEAEQRADLEAALSSLDRLGVTAHGYRAPYWQVTEATLRLLGGFGVDYDSSLMDDDRPYQLIVGEHTLAELPVHWSLDDWEQYAYLPDPPIGHQIEAPSKVVDLWTAELDAMRRTGSLYVMTCHPFISGRPSRIEAIARFIEFARDAGDVGFSTTRHVADAVLGTAG